MVATVTIDALVAIVVRAVTIHTKASSCKYKQHQHRFAEREIDCKKMHAYDTYESMQNHPNAK